MIAPGIHAPPGSNRFPCAIGFGVAFLGWFSIVFQDQILSLALVSAAVGPVGYALAWIEDAAQDQAWKPCKHSDSRASCFRASTSGCSRDDII
jgi:hypothetical protein